MIHQLKQRVCQHRCRTGAEADKATDVEGAAGSSSDDKATKTAALDSSKNETASQTGDADSASQMKDANSDTSGDAWLVMQ